MKRLLPYFLGLSCLLIMYACAPSRMAKSDVKVVQPQYNELIDYLRRVPGLQITPNGDSYAITVRGMSSVNGTGEPLFVVDGDQIGNYNQAASLVDPNNIRYVNVLKDVASTSPYGFRGANGVIVIYSKK